MLSIADWHKRYISQAQWTCELRRHLYRRVNLFQANRILDVGCGTGVLESEFSEFTQANIYGLDLDMNALRYSLKNTPDGSYVHANAYNMPFSPSSFDICLCHFFFLWIRLPQIVFDEMIRVTRPGGSILILAEPDYGGRIDFPPELEIIGRWQRDSLISQGADPFLGRKLASLFHDERVSLIEYGVLGGKWKPEFDKTNWEIEWKLIAHDLEFLTEKSVFDSLAVIKKRDFEAYLRGERVLFVPTFYAWGKVN